MSRDAKSPVFPRGAKNCCDASSNSGASGDIVAVDIFDVSNIVKWSWAINGLMSSAALLVPMMAVPESRIQSEGAGTGLQATAHLNFKIVIPKVLYLHVAGANDHDAQTVAIMSNSRNVWLTATLRTPEVQGPDGAIRSSADSATARGNVILSAAARKVIAQDTACSLSEPGAGRPSAGATQLVCTASMP
jgi:hypothetical protein